MPKRLSTLHRYPEYAQLKSKFRYHIGIQGYQEHQKHIPNWEYVADVYKWCEEYFGFCQYEYTEILGGRWFHGGSASFFFTDLADVLKFKLRFPDLATEFIDYETR